MKESLKSKLVTLIKEKKKVHWKELERFCDKYDYRWADNGSKRLREVRDKNDKSYDPTISVSFYPNTDTIEYYIYQSGDVAPIINKASVEKRHKSSSDWWELPEYQRKPVTNTNALF